MIEDKHKEDLERLIAAAVSNQIALVECTEQSTGEKVVVLCIVGPRYPDIKGYQHMDMLPIARLFKDNPDDEVIPPK